MPPRTRSNRAALIELESILASGKPVNSTGFASLPNEIHGEIVSHIPRVPVSCHTQEENKEFITERFPPTEQLERHVILHSLSQTCRSLRPVFLRYLWQTIEVYDGLKLVGGRRLLSWRQRMKLCAEHLKLKPFAEELLRQLEIVTVRNPTLAQHVNSINILIVPYSMSSVYQELLRCIPLLPNLTTVRLYCDHDKVVYPMPDVHQYSDVVFPQIRHAYLDTQSLSFASACPNLISLSSSSYYKRPTYRSHVWRWSQIGDQILAGIEVLGSVPFDEGLLVDLRRLTNLRDITLEIRLVLLLMKDKRHDYANDFKRLQTVRIRADQLRYNRRKMACVIPVPGPSKVAEWVEWAEKILRRVQQHDKQVKRIYLTVYEDAPRLYLLEPGMPTQSLTLPL